MATHNSNPNGPSLKEGVYARMVIEEGKTFFKKESLFRKISQMLFLLRENPQLLAEFFAFVQDVPASYEKSIGE